tara:strand:+ start:1127 stop:1804 length:678 start_codon:yes stop_codon:yes gene_type:complete
MYKKEISDLENTISFKFKDQSILRKSLTHKSFDNDDNNETLEFLGDRVLGLVISEKLINDFPNDSEGLLDKRYSKLVNKETCYKVSQSLNLGDFILLGSTEINSKGNEKKSILADTCESLIGAIYSDSGYEESKKFICKFWNEEFESMDSNLIDPKSFLQEWTLKRYKELPEYKLLDQSGPDHDPLFSVELSFKEYKKAANEGKSIKDAEMKAAESFLRLNKIVK